MADPPGEWLSHCAGVVVMSGAHSDQIILAQAEIGSAFQKLNQLLPPPSAPDSPRGKSRCRHLDSRHFSRCTHSKYLKIISGWIV